MLENNGAFSARAETGYRIVPQLLQIGVFLCSFAPQYEHFGMRSHHKTMLNHPTKKYLAYYQKYRILQVAESIYKILAYKY